MAKGRDFFQEPVDYLETEFLMSHFPAAKTESHFDLHVFAKEVDGMAKLHGKIMRIDVGAKLDLFDSIGVLVLFRLLVALSLLVAEFAKIDKPTDWRYRIRGDLNQVDSLLPGHGESIS
jgi:hypothetical protein